MTIPAALLLALSLSMDSFAAALTRGAACTRVELREALRIATAFAAFQAVAPLLGWALGTGFAEHLAAFDHWVAFALLAAIGAKLFRDGLVGGPATPGAVRLSTLGLAALALATSIDAAAVGISLALLPVDILATALLIGGVTFAVSLGGTLLGRLAAPALGPRALILGGVGLIGLGVKILFDHGAFG